MRSEINGKEINLSSLPVLVINNVAYMRAITVFKTGLGADVDIDSSTGKISITMNGKTIVMYEGSSTAYLDGTAVDIASSPKYVTNLDNGYSALLIPGDYVAEYLEADCRFDLDKKCSILQPMVIL